MELSMLKQKYKQGTKFLKVITEDGTAVSV